MRDHVGPETETLGNYRQRYAQYKTDTDLQAAHAVAPRLVVFDDHELDNNWADEVPEHPETPQPNFLARRGAALRAYWENMPLRKAQRPKGIDMRLYRSVSWGRMAGFHMLDTRQYRGDQPCDDKFNTDCTARTDPARSLPGSQQEKWIAEEFRRSQARWDVLGQQMFLPGRLHPRCRARLQPRRLGRLPGFAGPRGGLLDRGEGAQPAGADR